MERIWQARQAISSKLGRFDGKNITRFIKVYEQIMEDNGVENDEIMENFEKVSEPDLRERISELRNEDDDMWQTFKTALKEEYFLEDEDRVTKQTFLKWIKQKNKGLSAPSLLREFEKRFDQLSAREQTFLEGEKVELFVEAADPVLQKSLGKDLEDPKGELGLTNTWKKVPDVISLIVKTPEEIRQTQCCCRRKRARNDSIDEWIEEQTRGDVGGCYKTTSRASIEL